MAPELVKGSKAVLEGPSPVCWEIGRARNERGNGMMMERLPKEVRSMISLSRISRLRGRRIVEWQRSSPQDDFLSSLLGKWEECSFTWLACSLS